MSLFSEYYLERENLKTFENEDLFFTYKCTDDGTEFHVVDMYIRPEKRGGACIAQLLNKVCEMATELKTKYIVSKVDCTSKNPEMSLKIMLKIGFKLLKAENNLVWLAMPTREKAV